MILRNPNNVYFALLTLVAVAAVIVYFFGWRTLGRRERDLEEFLPPKKHQ